MGVLLKGILVAALVAAATASSIEWRELHAPEHHVHAVKCAKVACPAPCIASPNIKGASFAKHPIAWGGVKHLPCLAIELM